MSQTSAHTSTNRTVDGVEVPLPGAYTIDPSHSYVGFVIRHLMVSKVRGQFTKFSGTVTIGEDPADSSVEVEVELDSVETNDEKRNLHLRSADFFNTEVHPTMTFKSTDVRHGKGDAWIVAGDLTLNNLSRPIELEVTYEGSAISPWGAKSVGFSATGKLNREEFGVNWNQALETGGFVVGKDVTLEIEAEAIAL